MRLIYHPDAEAELIEAARFYEQRIHGLGARFLDSGDRAIKAISEDSCFQTPQPPPELLA